jgi:hypothetical protein
MLVLRIGQAKVKFKVKINFKGGGQERPPYM